MDPRKRTLAEKMVRNYKPKTDRGKVDGSLMKRAIEDVMKDRSVRQTSKDLAIDRITLPRDRALHNEAGVPLGPWTYKEIAIFEEFLDVQVAVISADSLNKVRGRGGLVVRSRPRDRRVASSKLDSTKDPPCMGPVAC
ncbi:hypothetical protein AVEN_184406-1 [Araneus ventricosus]|uniref:Uncharacterized protein n=1 Tax=Araneus ventricosus TaxID=182803 RepID=A0A4Y2BIC2_ARAVE|nr:hypothetical protein AVEN_184406-1 [Araneus ventricosus]